MNAVLPLKECLGAARCGRCDGELASAVQGLPGVRDARVDPASESLVIEFDTLQGPPERIVRRALEEGRRIAGSVRHRLFHVSGMDCPGCGLGISKAAMRVPGISWASVNFGAGTLLVEGTGEAAARVAEEVRGLGYGVTDQAPRRPEPAPGQSPLRTLRAFFTGIGLLALTGAPLLAAGFAASWLSHPRLAVGFFAASLAVTGLPTALRGLRLAVASRAPDMFFLMSAACAGAAATGQWSEASTAMFLFVLGNALEAFTMGRTRDAIRGLVSLAPREAVVRRDGHEEKVPAESLAPGMIVVVRPGERIPADGTVATGTSSVNEAMITGESAPAEKRPGGAVFAGTLNGTGTLEVRVDRAAADATVNRIADLVESARARRAPSQAFIERFARVYTPAVLLLALAVAIGPALLLHQPFRPWLERALVLLVVSCPCALVISTPVSILSAIATASRNGVLVKGGAALEALGRVRAVAFDKTGTLTEGVFEVTDAVPIGVDVHTFLRRAAVAALAGEHPLSKAVVSYAHGEEIRPESARKYEAIPGLGARVEVDGVEHVFGSPRLLRERGISVADAETTLRKFETEGKTCAILATREGPLGVLAFSDRIREAAPGCLRDLRAAGVEATVLLTGDNETVARAVADRLGVTDVRAGLLPGDKAAAVEELRARWQRLAMVGDGVNDAPALAAATVGVAMGAAGSDVALETADVALMSSDLRRVPWALRLGRRTTGVIRQNVALSLGFKLLVLALAVAGVATLWMAVAADVGVSLLVTLNGMRLLERKDA